MSSQNAGGTLGPCHVRRFSVPHSAHASGRPRRGSGDTVWLTACGGGPADVIASSSLVLGALLAGETLRARQALQRSLAEDAARAREASAQHRFDSERLALAHELHDIIGHTLVAINVRASAAAHRGRNGA